MIFFIKKTYLIFISVLSGACKISNGPYRDNPLWIQPHSSYPNETPRVFMYLRIPPGRTRDCRWTLWWRRSASPIPVTSFWNPTRPRNGRCRKPRCPGPWPRRLSRGRRPWRSPAAGQCTRCSWTAVRCRWRRPGTPPRTPGRPWACGSDHRWARTARWPPPVFTEISC